MNAFAVGSRSDSVIAITDALNLTQRELAGVLAHEISHIAHGDMKVMAFADMVSRFTSVMSTVGILSLILNISSFIGGGGEQVPWLAVIVLMAAPTVGGLLQMALSRTREFDADLGAATLTGQHGWTRLRAQQAGVGARANLGEYPLSGRPDSGPVGSAHASSYRRSHRPAQRTEVGAIWRCPCHRDGAGPDDHPARFYRPADRASQGFE